MIGLFAFFATMAITAPPVAVIFPSAAGLFICLGASAVAGLKAHSRFDLNGKNTAYAAFRDIIRVDWSALKDRDQQIACSVLLVLIVVASWFLYSLLSN